MNTRRRIRALLAGAFRRYAAVALLPFLLNAAPAATAAVDGGDGDRQAWGQGSGTGSIIAEVQPGTSAACDASHQCEITASGTASTGASFGGHGQFGLQADLTADIPHGATNGFGGQCYPLTGTVTLNQAQDHPRRDEWHSGTLVVQIQGQDRARPCPQSQPPMSSTEPFQPAPPAPAR